MKRKTEILYVIDSLGIGGAERQLVELIKGLNIEKYSIHLIALERMDNSYVEFVSKLGVTVNYVVRSQRYDIVGPVLRIIKYVIRCKIDIVHTFLNMGSFFGAVAAKLTGRPVICSAIRDAKDKSFKEKILKRFLAKLADIYVANSRSGFENRFSQMRGNFRVINNGVDFSRFCFSSDISRSIRDEFQLSRFEHIVGMVASFSEHKDHDTLIDSIPLVLAKVPSVGFVFIGDGNRKAYIEGKVNRLGLSGNVVFTGYRQDVDIFYSVFDLCVLLTNSKVHLEGISNALVESMIVGVPVVASAGGGTDELIKNGTTGLIVPSKSKEDIVEAICHVLKCDEFSSMLVRNAKKDVSERFSLNKCVKKYEELYSYLVK